MTEEKYAILHIEGGLGKHIAGTALAKCIKNNHPDRKLILVVAWVEPFITLDFVDRVYRLGNTPYFYEDYIKDKDSILFKGEPYFTTNHIHHRSSLIENWCGMFGLKYSGEEPSLVFNLRNKQIANNKWQSDKPIMVIQSNGGLFNDESGFPYSWARDMPLSVVHKLVQHYKDRYTIYQVTSAKANIVAGVIPINQEMPQMEYLSILLKSSKRILIDSSLQHAAKALGLPSTVLWVATHPEVFGYDLHDNIIARQEEEVKIPDSYIFDYNFDGVTHECPYLEDDFFDVDKIIKSVNAQPAPYA